MPLAKHILSTSIFFLFLFIQTFGQGQPIMLQGRVVEVTDGKPVGVPNVKVIVPGESEDVTKLDGSFTLYLPPNVESVFINLENCQHPMVSPYAGRVNIPPSGILDIKICAAANKKLRAKIEGLNSKVKSLERQRTLSTRQLSELHQTLLDTILYFENQIQSLSADLAERDELIQEQQEKIEALESKVSSLEEQLFYALEEKYQRQKSVFDGVAALLEQYVDEAKNMRDAFRPTMIKSYFSLPAARERLYETMRNYNSVRDAVLENYESHVADVSNYWEAYWLADELMDTYQYLMDEVHKEGIYPLEFSVNDPLKQALSRQISNSKARKSAEVGAEAAIPALNPRLDNLEQKADAIINKLKNNL